MITTSTKAREMVDAMKDAAPQPAPLEYTDREIVEAIAIAQYEATRYPEHLEAWPWGSVLRCAELYRRDAAKQLNILRARGLDVLPSGSK